MEAVETGEIGLGADDVEHGEILDLFQLVVGRRGQIVEDSEGVGGILQVVFGGLQIGGEQYLCLIVGVAFDGMLERREVGMGGVADNRHLTARVDDVDIESHAVVVRLRLLRYRGQGERETLKSGLLGGDGEGDGGAEAVVVVVDSLTC